MDKLIINAQKRTETGKKAAQKLRAEGSLPAVMYNSKGESVMLAVNESEFSKVRKVATPTTLVSLVVDGEKEKIAFIKDTHYNIISDSDIHVDFHVIEEDVPLKVKMKVQVTGNPVGVREGGVFEKSAPVVTIQCLPKDLPPRIVADASDLGLNAQILVKDLPLAKGITVLSDSEVLVAQVRPNKA